MSENKFTPGPWVWSVMDYSMAILHTEGEDPEMSSVMDACPCRACANRQKEKGYQFGVCTTPNEANAKLIAAAPDLFEALERLLSEACTGKICTGELFFRDNESSRESIRIAQAALKKAGSK